MTFAKVRQSVEKASSIVLISLQGYADDDAADNDDDVDYDDADVVVGTTYGLE